MRITETAIPGLLVLDLDVHGDNRGWFKENWQREKIRALAAEHPRLASLAPVQNNISFNDAVGTTRGIHAEPWDKYVAVAHGRICLLYTSPSPRDQRGSRMPSSA